MNSTLDTTATADPVPSPALANTRRDARPKERLVTRTEASSGRFERLLQTAWRRATARGFAPGREREDLLEAEFGRAAGRGRARSD